MPSTMPFPRIASRFSTYLRVLAHALLRAAVLGLLLLAYDPIYVRLFRDDDGLGEGLLAFTLVVGICAVWGVVDGLRTTPSVWTATWLLAGAAFATGWGFTLGDGSVGAVGFLEFMALLVVLPALGGAGLAWGIAWLSRDRTPASGGASGRAGGRPPTR